MQSVRRFLNSIFKSKTTLVPENEDTSEINKEYLYDYEMYYAKAEIATISATIYANLAKLNEQKPTYDDIDNMLVACNYYLENDLKIYEELIFNSPCEFMLAYSNNSERTPLIIKHVKTFNIELANYILKFTNCGNKQSWSERYEIVFE